MKKYAYEARDSASNKIVKSVVQAESEHAAARLLTDQGFVPLKIELEDDKSNVIDRILGRITSKDKILFTRQLSTLIGAGLPLSQSMRTVLEQTSNKRMQGIVQEVIADIEGGKQLSDAFSKHPEIFDKLFIALVSAGEASGTLDEALKRVANQQEKDAAMLRKVKGALTYPSIVLAVIVMVVGFMTVSVVQLMVSIADFFINFWWLLAILLGFGIYFFVQYLRTEAGIHMKDKFKLNVPLFKGMFRKLYMARFTRTGQTLLSTGVPMLDMLKIAADGVNNVIVSEEIMRAADKVKGGKALSLSLKSEEYILEMVPHMIKIGEQSGKVDEMMGKTAQIYENELDEEIKAISTAIEPVLMVFLAIVAAGMVGAILFPIYSLVNHVGI